MAFIVFVQIAAATFLGAGLAIAFAGAILVLHKAGNGKPPLSALVVMASILCLFAAAAYSLN